MTRHTTMNISCRGRALRAFAVASTLSFFTMAEVLHAQAPVPAPMPGQVAASPAAESAAVPVPPLELASLAWLDGCWRGQVGQYEFREHWLPLRGGLMIGAGHVVFEGKSQDYGYLRLETRPDGVYYVSISSARKEAAFKLSAATIDDKDTIFTFTNPVDEFPLRVVYRRGTEGWLYAAVEGKVKGEETTVIYPMRRVDCQSGDILRK